MSRREGRERERHAGRGRQKEKFFLLHALEIHSSDREAREIYMNRQTEKQGDRAVQAPSSDHSSRQARGRQAAWKRTLHSPPSAFFERQEQ